MSGFLPRAFLGMDTRAFAPWSWQKSQSSEECFVLCDFGTTGTDCYGTQAQKDYFSCQSKAAKCSMKKEVDNIDNLQIYALQIQSLSLYTGAAVRSQQCQLARVVCLHGCLFFTGGTPLAIAICVRLSVDTYSNFSEVTPPLCLSCHICITHSLQMWDMND